MSLNELPLKHRNSYNSLIKHFESKNYKKALKLADQILAAHPRNGDTIAFKALVMSTQNPKKLPEAFPLAREAIKCNIKGHIPWHVLGLLHKAKGEYPLALKAFKTALKHDPSNPQILKDTGLLQTHLRDYTGLVETRRTTLTENPRPANNWYQFAVAHHMNGNFEGTVEVLKDFLDTVKGSDTRTAVEKSEVYLYYAELLLKTRKYSDLKQLLLNHEAEILDVFEVLKIKSVLAKFGYWDGQEKDYLFELIELNSDNRLFLENYLSLFDDENEGISQLLANFPKSVAVWNLYLEFNTENPKFDSILELFITKFSVPPLSNMLLGLCDKFPEVSEKVKKGLETSLETFRSESDWVKASWTAFALANVILEKSDKGQSKSDELLNLSELVNELFSSANLSDPESFIIRAKIFCVMGQMSQACSEMEKARNADPGDRFINHLSVEILLDSGLIDDAIDLSRNFCAKDTSRSTYFKNIQDYQASFLHLMYGKAYLKQQAFDKALVQFNSILNHYEDYVGEFFDFHLYCVSRGYLRSYVSALGSIHEYKKSKFYLEALVNLISIYSELSTNSELHVRLLDSARRSQVDEGHENSHENDDEYVKRFDLVYLLEKNPQEEMSRLVLEGKKLIDSFNDSQKASFVDLIKQFDNVSK
ncbi:hypothetical protein P9112_014208 [Eukaryota sp. TZLM1-RC]